MKQKYYIINVYLPVFYFLLSILFDIYRLKAPISLTTTIIIVLTILIIIPIFHSFILKRAAEFLLKYNLVLLLLLSFFLFFSDWSKFLFSFAFVNRIVTSSSYGNFLVLFFWITFFTLAIIFIYWIKFDLKPIAAFAIILYSVLIVSKVYSLFTYKHSPIFLSAIPNLPEKQTQTISNKKLPDIFYIILDGYSSENSLTKYWHFDNSDFSNFLKNNGFYIAAESRSNYNVTIPSLSSSLNSSYLSIEDGDLVNNAETAKLFDIVQNNTICRYLAANGYKIMPYTIFNVDKYPGRVIKDWNEAPRITLWDYIAATWNRRSKQKKFCENVYQYNIGSFKYLDSCSQVSNLKEQPHFYFIHSLTTHSPYTIDSAGAFNFEKLYSRNKYIEAIEYSNKRLKRFINTILNDSNQQKPIIILQGDHGSHLNNIAESFTILNAYYFPDKDYNLLSKDISPVNSFRVLLNKYFNTKLTVLPNKQYNVHYY